MNSVVLTSGGLDSTVVLRKAMEVSDRCSAVTVSYGQRHRKEVDAAEAIADFYEIHLHHIAFLLPKSDSVLMKHDAEMPHASYEELAASVGPSPTYVPFRNANLLSQATAYALSVNADTVWCGMHAEDARGWAYPDCTPEFIGAMANAIYVGTYHRVRLLAPLQHMMKVDIVREALALKVPLHLTWSCYEGHEYACGKCPTCVSRLEAFKRIGERDPIVYEWDLLRGV